MVLLIGIAMVISVSLSAIVPAGDLHETGLDLEGWGISLSITLTVGTALFIVGYVKGKRSGRSLAMRRREAMALVGAGWFACSCAAALP